uniref:GRAS07 protein n=1 Tax=Rhizophora mucronata TaxID=61149 RepID=A0A2P2N297_RHIMU
MILTMQLLSSLDRFSWRKIWKRRRVCFKSLLRHFKLLRSHYMSL